MNLLVQPEAPPLRQQADGSIRVGDSRVLLELVVRAFEDGATPESIVQRYPSLTLQDTYAVIAYFLRHADEIRAYIGEREQLAAEVKSRLPQTQRDMSAHAHSAFGQAWPIRGTARLLRMLADENFNSDIVRGLLLRNPGLDLLRAQDVSLQGRDDPSVLQWASDNNRILLTHDRATMPHHAIERLAAGIPVTGVFALDDRFPVGRAIEELLLITACSEQDEWRNLVVFLPL